MGISPLIPYTLNISGIHTGPSIGNTGVTTAFFFSGAAPFAPKSGMLVIALGPVRALENETPPPPPPTCHRALLVGVLTNYLDPPPTLY